jgi:four helix bundle protein
MGVKDYRELRVYQSAFEMAVRIHEITKGLPVEERYSLTDQIRRSSRSVCANIAEAWRKRRYPKNFVSKFSDADSEAAETIVGIEFAHKFGYLDAEVYTQFVDVYDHICRQLTIMMSVPDQWKPKTQK